MAAMLKKLLTVVAAAALTFGGWVMAVELRADHPDTYVVKKGDTLTAIVRENGSGNTDVSTVKNTALASGIKNPNLIRPGQLIRVPV